MKYMPIFLLLFLLVASVQAQLIESTIMVDDMERHYVVELPENFDAQNASPVLIVLHGSGGTGITETTLTRFSDYTADNNLILVYPSGYRQGWFALDSDEYRPGSDVVDDVLFMEMLLEQLQTDYNIDPERIYITGYSNGGSMTYRLMCELPVAGVAIVASTPTPEIANHCLEVENPVDTLVILGTNDHVFPLAGLAAINGDILNIRFSFAQMTGFLSTLLNCDTEKEVFRIDDNTSPYQVVREFRTCAEETRFDAVFIVEHDHAYPVTPAYVLSDRTTIGNTEQLILDFFGLLS